jgi:hypothetical protein
MNKVTIPGIEKLIFIIRNQKVMLDSDLAELYKVETSALTRQVRRNLNRFPNDFMFELTQEEFDEISTLVGNSGSYGGRRYLPMVFTESGVAMLSSILTSERAALVNISIMRTFIKLRSFLAMESSLTDRVDKIEQGANRLFKVVFERLDSVEDQVNPKLQPNRKKISLKIE